MIKIGLISYYSDFEKYPNKYALGTLRIASKLSSLNALSVKIITINCDDFNIDDYKFSFNDLDIIGFGLYNWTVDISSELRNKYIDSTTEVILGGPSANYLNPKQWQNNEIIILGEGEHQIYNLIKNKYHLKDKISFSNDNKIEDITLFEESIINTIPLYDKRVISDIGLKNIHEFTWFETTRGCPYNCAFCGHKTRNNVACFPIEFTKKEIQNIGENKIKKVFIVDPVLGGSKKRGKEILKMFNKYSPISKLIIYLRTETLDSEYMNIIANSNISEIRIGIQTLNPNVPGYIRSNSLKAIFQYLPLLKEYMISWRAELIIGLPGDNFDGFIKTLKKIIDEIHPTYLCAYRLTIIQGTKMYELLHEKGNNETLWIEKDEKNRITCSSTFSSEELTKMMIFGNAITALYNLNVYIYNGKAINLIRNFDDIYNFVIMHLNTIDFSDSSNVNKYKYSYFEKKWKKSNIELDK